MVVGRQRERPRLDVAVILREQAYGAVGGEERITALIDDVIDPHVADARRAHELPHTGRADFRIRGRIERRLDVRQRRELAGQTLLVERLVDVRLPGAGADQPRAEAIRLAELEAHALHGGLELRVAHAVGEHREHALLLGVQILARAGAELRDDVAIGLDAALDAAAALARLKSSWTLIVW